MKPRHVIGAVVAVVMSLGPVPPTFAQAPSPTTLAALQQAIADQQAAKANLQATLTAVDAVLATLSTELSRLQALQPIDCSGTWSAWTPVTGSCSVCDASGTQTCTEERTFTVVTQPANGGAGCPSPLTETRAVTQACTPAPVLVETCNADGTGNLIDEDQDGLVDEICLPPPPPPPSGVFAYDTECLQSGTTCASLRDPKQLQTVRNGGYAFCNSCALDFTYNPSGDPDPRRQDAAKAVVGTSSNSIRNQLRIPVPAYGSNPLLLRWEAWYGQEMDYAIAGIDTWKHFQVADGAGSDPRFNEIRSRFGLAPGSDIAKVDVRYYGSAFGSGTQWGPADTIAPQTGQFTIKPETWTTYVYYLRPVGSYNEVSLWVGDAKQGFVQILDKRLVEQQTVTQFWFELNTSLDTVKAGRPPLVNYYRNFFARVGVTDPMPFLVF
jgi:hypothetical protein